MKRHIRHIIVICVVFVSGCINLPKNYYAPSASGGTFLPPAEPACFIQLDWIRLTDNGATFDISAVREANALAIMLYVNKHDAHAPAVKLNLGEVALRNASGDAKHFPIATNQVDFRKSPTSWPIEPLVITDGGYYMFRYSGIADISEEKFLLVFPEVMVGERVVKLPQVKFDKKYGTACDSGR